MMRIAERWKNFKCRQGWHNLETIDVDSGTGWFSWVWGTPRQVPITIYLKRCRNCGKFTGMISGCGTSEERDLVEILSSSLRLFTSYCDAGGTFSKEAY
jgi:hypothetical protein